MTSEVTILSLIDHIGTPRRLFKFGVLHRYDS